MTSPSATNTSIGMEPFEDDGTTEGLVEAFKHNKLCYDDFHRRYYNRMIRKCEDPATLKLNTRSFCWAFHKKFQGYFRSGDVFEPELRRLWWDFYLYAKFIDANSAAMSQHAFQLVQLREQGTLLRYGKEDGVPETVPTSEGMVWTDLPYFVSDMTEHWVKDCATMSAAHRVNFSRFLSKLASVSLFEDRVCAIALIVFRETLETPRPFGEAHANDDEDPDRTTAQLTVCDLLPVLHSWLCESSRKILQLSDQSRNNFPAEVQDIGVLYRDDGKSSLKAPGFSPERWIFWLRRLDEIHQETQAAGQNEILEGVLGSMFITVDEMPSAFVKTEFEKLETVIKHRVPGVKGPRGGQA